MEVQSNFWSGILRFYDSRLVLVYTSKFTAAGQGRARLRFRLRPGRCLATSVQKYA